MPFNEWNVLCVTYVDEYLLYDNDQHDDKLAEENVKQKREKKKKLENGELEKKLL